MAKIFYSMCGEGRGHAARVRSIVDHLKHDHELVLFAPEQAHDFLAPKYECGADSVEVRRIPGMRFQYTGGQLDLYRSIAGGLTYLMRLHRVVDELAQTIRDERPNLVITDFEPALPRAAERCKVPYISLDHQHFLAACDLRSLPFGLRQWARAMRTAVRMHHWRQQATIVSSFFKAPLRVGSRNVQLVGPLLRPEILNAAPTLGDYFVSYLRPHTSPATVEMLQQCGRPIRVYGLGAREPDGNLTFHALDNQKFVDDVSGAAALIGAAGNQTIGEALYLGKPVLALPERKHHEQRINAHFVEQMGAGQAVTIEDLRPRHLERFFASVAQCQRNVARYFRGQINGTPHALAAIQRFLPQPAR